MDWLRIDNADIGVLCLGLLASAVAGYLLRVPAKSRGTAWLAGLATALALTLAAALAPAFVTLNGRGAAAALLALDALFLAVSGVAALGFAVVAYAERPSPAGRFAVVAGVVGTGLLAVLTAVAGRFKSPEHVPTASYVLAAVAYLAAGGVLAARWRAGEGGTERRSRALRAFAALMPLGAAAAGASYAAAFWGLPEPVAWGALLAVLLGLVTLYVNFAPEPTTLQAKVTAFVLAAALTALAGAVALGNRPEDLARSSGVTAPERTAVRFEPQEGGGYLVDVEPGATVGLGDPLVTPSPWDGAAVDVGFDFPFGGRTWRTVEVSPTGIVRLGPPEDPSGGRPLLAPLHVPLSVDSWDLPRAYVERSDGRLTVTWLAVSSEVAKESAQFQLILERPGTVTFRYGEVGFARSVVRAFLPQGTASGPLRVADGPLPDAVPAAGVLQTVSADYAAHTSARLLPWAALAVGLTVGVLVGLPLLLRTSVTRPLHRLLTGVRRVEAGDLGTEVDVEAPDEIGRLTGHFNRMTRSLREANDELRAYAETLEGRVAERTAELAAEKEGLARTLEELRQTQARLVQQEKLASLGRLMSGIAHELKNPLNFITNFSSLSRELTDDLAADLQSDPDTRLADVADKVEDLGANADRVLVHGRRADAIVHGMMDHVRIGTEPFQTIDLNDLVATHVAVARAGTNGEVEVTESYGDSVGAVEAAPQTLGKAVVNLISNALDAVAERQGGPDAPPPHVSVRTRPVQGGVEIAVRDNGVGIAPDAVPRLYEPFYTTKPTGQGNVGFGLWFAQDVVRGHGGEIRVESAEGEGATFSVTLPVAGKEAAAVGEPP